MKKSVISGVLLLNKSQGISSHAALSRAKFLLKSEYQDSKKAGHTGTLDPMATGLLPLCFGEATKFAQYGLDADKGYRATIALGVATDSADADGNIIQTASVPTFTQAYLDEIATGFLGNQQQIPPMYSALKKDGKKLYEYARAGEIVQREARSIQIHQFKLLKLDENHVQLNVVCSKGTYVRVLGEDVARALGTCGHLTQLHREMTGGFNVQDAITLQDFSELPMIERLQRLLPIDAMLCHLPKLTVDPIQKHRLQVGQRLNVKDRINQLDDFTEPQLIRIYSDEIFVGLAQIEKNGRLQPKKMLA